MRRRPLPAAAAAAVLLAPQLAQAGAAEQLYERTVMTAADRRCRLFPPPVAAALDAARLQARGATLRSGAAEDAVTALERRARARAAGARCGSRDLVVASGRVRTAFAEWSRLTRMTFAGERQDWVADRDAGRAARWRLRQDARLGFERAALGVGGTQSASALVASVEGPRPASARLVMRDAARAARPIVNGALATRAPRGSAARVWLAELRTDAPLGLRVGRDPATSFRFPRQALAAMSTLDPREAVGVEFVDARGGQRTAWFEVGDFAAAQAFLTGAPG